MEYEKDNGDYLEFRISDNPQWSAYMILKGKETEMLIQPTLEDVMKAVGRRFGLRFAPVGAKPQTDAGQSDA